MADNLPVLSKKALETTRNEPGSMVDGTELPEMEKPGAEVAGRGAEEAAGAQADDEAAVQREAEAGCGAADIAAGNAAANETAGAGNVAGETVTALEKRIKDIKKEKSRLAKQFREIDKKSRAVVDGLIEQAAFLRVQLQELADDINQNGTTELFAQGKDQEPYERQRPAANVYNSMNANYQKIIKQLNELLPKPVKNTEVKDGFRDFVNGRDVF